MPGCPLGTALEFGTCEFITSPAWLGPKYGAGSGWVAGHRRAVGRPGIELAGLVDSSYCGEMAVGPWGVWRLFCATGTDCDLGDTSPS